MKPEDELALKITKEIVVKFIEVGRLSVNSFEDAWKRLYGTINSSIKKSGGKD